MTRFIIHYRWLRPFSGPEAIKLAGNRKCPCPQDIVFTANTYLLSCMIAGAWSNLISLSCHTSKASSSFSPLGFDISDFQKEAILGTDDLYFLVCWLILIISYIMPAQETRNTQGFQKLTINAWNHLILLETLDRTKTNFWVKSFGFKH